MPTNADLVQRLRAYPKPLLSDDPKLFEHIIAHLERTAALEATPTLEQIKACVADAKDSWLRCSNAKEKLVANDMHNQIMESLTALYAQPVPPSDTSAERVTEKAKVEHVAPGGNGNDGMVAVWNVSTGSPQPAGDDVDWPTEPGVWFHGVSPDAWLATDHGCDGMCIIDGSCDRWVHHKSILAKREGLIGGWRRVAPGDEGEKLSELKQKNANQLKTIGDCLATISRVESERERLTYQVAQLTKERDEAREHVSRMESELAMLSKNPVDKIAANCGWLPLAVHESMTVHFEGREYHIERTLDGGVTNAEAKLSAAQQQAEAAEAYKTAWEKMIADFTSGKWEDPTESVFARGARTCFGNMMDTIQKLAPATPTVETPDVPSLAKIKQQVARLRRGCSCVYDDRCASCDAIVELKKMFATKGEQP